MRTVNVRIVSTVAVLAHRLASELEDAGLGPIRVVRRKPKAFDLRHRPSVPAARVAEILRVMQPLRPEVCVDEHLPDGVDVEVRLGGSQPGRYQLRIVTETPAMEERLRAAVGGLGFRDAAVVRRPSASNVLLHCRTVPAFVRQALRWVLSREGIDVVDYEPFQIEGLHELELWVSDPEQGAKPARDRVPIAVLTDDMEAGRRLADLLRPEGFQIATVRVCTSFDKHWVHMDRFGVCPGVFEELGAGAETAKLQAILYEFMVAEAVDLQRYPLRVLESIDLDTLSEETGAWAAMMIPLAAARAGELRAYDGPFPERFPITIFTDGESEIQPLVQRLREAGFPEPQVRDEVRDLDKEHLEDNLIDGVLVKWGAAERWPKISSLVLKEVGRALDEVGGTGLRVQTEPAFEDTDPDIRIYFPARSIREGTLAERLASPRRFSLAIYAHDSERFPRLREALERMRFRRCLWLSSLDRDAEILYGGPPPACWRSCAPSSSASRACAPG